MTRVVSAGLGPTFGSRIGFSTRGHRGHTEDFKARCATLGRMDLYRAVDASGSHSFSVVQVLAGIAAGVVSGHVDVAALEGMVAKLAASSRKRAHGDARYKKHAQQSARATLAYSPNTCREHKAKQALALPDLFPDDEPS